MLRLSVLTDHHDSIAVNHDFKCGHIGDLTPEWLGIRPKGTLEIESAKDGVG